MVHDCRKRPRLWPILHAWGKIMQVGSRKYSWRSDDLAGSGWTIIIVTYDRFNGVPAAHLRWQWARSKPVAAIGWFGGKRQKPLARSLNFPPPRTCSALL